MTDPTDLNAVPTIADLEDPDWATRRTAAQRAWVEDQLAKAKDPKQIESLRGWLAQMDYAAKNPAGSRLLMRASAIERGDVLALAVDTAAQAYSADPENRTKRDQYYRLLEASRNVMTVSKQTIRDQEAEIARLHAQLSDHWYTQ
jgi:hypothetical protein